MRIQVLISTMNRESLDFLDSMNLSSDVVVGNQNGNNHIKTYNKQFGSVLMICSDKRGLSNNRNTTLEHASGDICILADDDLLYEDNYVKIVEEKFKKHPQADIIVFNIKEKIPKRYVINKEHWVGRFEYLKYSSVRIAFKRKSIIDSQIIFDAGFGAGAPVPMGEDNIFLHDCLKKKLRILACPDYLVTLKDDRESTWFKGYDDLFFRNKGKFYKRLNPYLWILLCIQDLIRHNRIYRINGSIIHNLSVMMS